jgi:hemerythrin
VWISWAGSGKYFSLQLLRSGNKDLKPLGLSYRRGESEMKKIAWQNSLSIGIELIDSQHKQWIEYFNRTSEAIASQENRMQVSKTLGFLIDYTETHFSTEEKFMTENRYDGLQGHKAKHDELRSTLATLVRDFEEEGITSHLTEAIDTFLGNWLIKHIQEVDAKFGAFIREKKITLS